MADKRIGDLGIALIIGIFVISIFSFAIIDMDNNTNNNEIINTHLNVVYNNISNNDNQLSYDLQTKTYGNGSAMTILPNQFIDTRGVGEGNIITQNYKSTFSIFIKNATDLNKWDYHGLIAKMVMGLISLVSIILFIRLWLGGFRV